MKSIKVWTNGLMLVLGLSVVIGALLTSGCTEGGDSAAIAAAPSTPPPQSVDAKLDEIITKLNTLSQQAGSANPTLRWDTKNPSASRFTALAAFNNAAVRDNDTGLVWFQQAGSFSVTWNNARDFCIGRREGGVRGWRLPSIAELTSLLDPSLPAPFVPTSVFSNVQTGDYWSATTDAVNPSNAWAVELSFGNVNPVAKSTNTANFTWCVRGPMQESVY